MSDKIHPMTADQRDRWDKIEIECRMLIDFMEADGDYGPEWANIARSMIQDMQDFVYYDPRDAA